MGSNSSRPGSRTARTRPNSRLSRFFSSLICGGSSSSRTARHEMEDYPDKILMNSAEQCCPVIEVQNSAEESSVVSNTVTGSRSSDAETGGSSGNSIRASEGTSVKYGYRNLDTNSRGKCLSDSKELVGPDQVSDSHDESGRNISIAEASTSFKERQSSDPVSMNVSTNMDSVNGIENSENEGFSQFYPDIIHTSSSNSPGHGDSCSNGLPFDNHMGEVTDMPNSNSDSVNHRSNVPVTFRSTQDESSQDPVPSDLGLPVPNREQGRTDGSVLHVDVVSISSSIYSSSNSDASSHEARRNSRRLFRDAFSRRSSRRHVDSPTIVFSTDNTDDLESHDRWLLDFSGDFFDDGIGSDSGYMSRRIHRLNERRQHSRSEIWERLRGGLDENGRRTTSCPSGLHPDGTCSCESFLMAEESSARGSISRIVMLAEALFEVLDEIHRQPVSLSLSMMSLPAPESVVDSCPLKNHKKLDRVKGNDEDEQCYICLAEYEEGDKIRVLPCHHEYHMVCVDKWLKEIHGVCPLCRGDVREGGASEPSIPNPEITST
ncbi:PREDICTED: E3 ubiquitin ligase BIG BROTHER-related-like isoform X2 [Populus euphratica]|uniref:E3 ubiquitin ligase BIG BROTHER-related-like isoform X2 n=1 Tax=Populus euphratica TaxID=75702 RepID=A0AAJ6TVY2_POPEU|nr:PREDICTED: E3 ubiquitin ligase BIG BROTHER-related-like isoform X2 [Populus euphratica]